MYCSLYTMFDFFFKLRYKLKIKHQVFPGKLLELISQNKLIVIKKLTLKYFSNIFLTIVKKKLVLN